MTLIIILITDTTLYCDTHNYPHHRECPLLWHSPLSPSQTLPCIKILSHLLIANTVLHFDTIPSVHQYHYSIFRLSTLWPSQPPPNIVALSQVSVLHAVHYCDIRYQSINITILYLGTRPSFHLNHYTTSTVLYCNPRALWHSVICPLISLHNIVICTHMSFPAALPYGNSKQYAQHTRDVPTKTLFPI